MPDRCLIWRDHKPCPKEYISHTLFEQEISCINILGQDNRRDHLDKIKVKWGFGKDHLDKIKVKWGFGKNYLDKMIIFYSIFSNNFSNKMKALGAVLECAENVLSQKIRG